MEKILETARLILREMTMKDLDFIAAMLSDPEVMRFYPRQYNREESQVWIEKQLRRYCDEGHGLWLVLNRETFQPVGQVGLLLQQVEKVVEPEIGYLIHRPFWRRGYATEAALGVREYAFNVLAKKRVISLIRPENLPSQGVARKIGMTPEREVNFRGLTHLVFAISHRKPDGPD